MLEFLFSKGIIAKKNEKKNKKQNTCEIVNSQPLPSTVTLIQPLSMTKNKNIFTSGITHLVLLGIGIVSGGEALAV